MPPRNRGTAAASNRRMGIEAADLLAYWTLVGGTLAVAVATGLASRVADRSRLHR